MKMKFTVEQIIERFKQLPKDMEVRIAGEHGGSFGIELINIFMGDDFVTIEMNTHDFKED